MHRNRRVSCSAAPTALRCVVAVRTVTITESHKQVSANRRADRSATESSACNRQGGQMVARVYAPRATACTKGRAVRAAA